MRVYNTIRDMPEEFGPSAVTIGKFDGVHLGHRAILDELLELARPRGLTAAVVTFDRRPIELLSPDPQIESLVSNQQKIDLLAEAGMDVTLMLRFDWGFSQQAPEEFVNRVLVGALRSRLVLVGSDFRYGFEGAGTVETLRQAGEEFGFEVVLVDEVRAKRGRRASSTWIRDALVEGKVREAAEVLGYQHTLRAEVVHGEKRGRQLGFPTANLSRDVEGLVPADGIYAGWLTVDGQRYPAAISIGNNPTFEGVPEKQVEANVLDATLDLYGKVVELSFAERIRGMVKFDSVDALIAQLGDDVQRTREILLSEPQADAPSDAEPAPR